MFHSLKSIIRLLMCFAYCVFRGHYSTMDGGDGTADLVINKRFVSEAELEERRKRRQEEWEKVRKPEDPKGMS